MTQSDYAAWISAFATFAATIVALFLPLYLKRAEQNERIKDSSNKTKIFAFMISIWIADVTLKIKLRLHPKMADIIIDDEIPKEKLAEMLRVQPIDTVDFATADLILLPKSGPDLAQLIWMMKKYNSLVNRNLVQKIETTNFETNAIDILKTMLNLAENVEQEISPILDKEIMLRDTKPQTSWRKSLLKNG